MLVKEKSEALENVEWSSISLVKVSVELVARLLYVAVVGADAKY